jgi:hypothetical protein
MKKEVGTLIIFLTFALASKIQCPCRIGCEGGSK